MSKLWISIPGLAMPSAPCKMRPDMYFRIVGGCPASYCMYFLGTSDVLTAWIYIIVLAAVYGCSEKICEV